MITIQLTHSMNNSEIIDEMVRHSHARGRRFDELQMLIRGRMSDAEVKAEMIRCSSDRRRFATLQELLPDGDGTGRPPSYLAATGCLCVTPF